MQIYFDLNDVGYIHVKYVKISKKLSYLKIIIAYEAVEAVVPIFGSVSVLVGFNKVFKIKLETDD